MKREYRVQEGEKGYSIIYGVYRWCPVDTLCSFSLSYVDATTIVAELNTVMDGTNAKLKGSPNDQG